MEGLIANHYTARASCVLGVSIWGLGGNTLNVKGFIVSYTPVPSRCQVAILNRSLPTFLGVASAVANPALTFAPLLMAALIASGLKSDQAIFLISAELVATSLAVIPTLIWNLNHNWQGNSKKLLLLVAMTNFASVFCESFVMLLALRVTTGVVEGVLLISILLIIADRSDSESIFSGKLAAQMVTGAIGLALFPVLISLWGIKSIYLVLALVCVLLQFVYELPPGHVSPRFNLVRAETLSGGHYLGHVSLILLFVFGSAVGLVWTFLERIGTRWSIPLETIGSGLSFATLVAIFVSLLSARHGTKSGRFLPLSLGLLAGIAGCLILHSASNILALFFLGAVLIGVARVVPIPYLFGCLAVVDHSKKMIILSHMALSIGLGLGPLLGLGFRAQNFYGIPDPQIEIPKTQEALAV